MWQLFSIVVGFLICLSNGERSVIGKNVTLECSGSASSATVIKLWWRYKNGSVLFRCEGEKCKENTTTHALATTDTFISFLTIQNVSLDHENDYILEMKTLRVGTDECRRNLIVTVPPTGLELVDADGNEPLQNNGSLKITEGENKTVVCKTNAPIKPAVVLEWIIPNGLNVSSNSSRNVQDVSDRRLSVPKLTLSFTSYVQNEEIVLVCRVASNSSSGDIRASIYIENEDHNKGKGLLAIAGGPGVAMLLIVLAIVGGFIHAKKRAVRHSVNAESSEFRLPQGRRSLPPTPSDQSSLPTNHLPDQPPPTSRLFRPVPSNPPDIPMRPPVPVSEDAIRRPAERTGSRMPGEIFTTDARTPVTQAQQELDTEMEYDLLNQSHNRDREAVPHVYKKTSNGLAEYALVSRPKASNRIDQLEPYLSKEMDDDSDYDLLNTWNQAEHGTVPHVYKETTSGLAEYAVVSKPDDKKKRQSLALSKVIKAPINVEAEYAVVDKSKKRAK